MKRLSRWQQYSLALVIVTIATIARMVLDPFVGHHSLYSTYFVAIMVVGWVCGPGPSLFSVVLSALAADYFFIPPRGSFQTEDSAYLVGMGLFTLVNLPIILLVASLRASRREAETRASALLGSKPSFATRSGRWS